MPTTWMRTVSIGIVSAFAYLLGFAAASLPARDDFEQAPVHYSEATPANLVSRLADSVAAGKTEIVYDEETGWLPSILKALDVPVSSQALVFAKNSLQRNRISPQTPRAVYFNDELFVGYVQDGDLLELSVSDPALGTVYYTIPQEKHERPQFTRENERCLVCHAVSSTQNAPGHLVRSVLVDRTGFPLLAAGTFRINHKSPIEERWAGWYVTGSHGGTMHLGNHYAPTRDRPSMDRARASNAGGQNRDSIRTDFDTSAYLSPHSDLVALLVLDHQADGLNHLAKATLEGRLAMHYEKSLNKELGEPADRVWESARKRIAAAGDRLVEYLLYSEEAVVVDRLWGTSEFVREFPARGPHDRRGRSLRDFDLERRMFRHPCSYLVYTPAFRELPPEMKAYVWKRLDAVLSAAPAPAPAEPPTDVAGKAAEAERKKFAHLSAADRRAIKEILADTHPDAPPAWKTSSLGEPAAAKPSK